MNIKKEMPIGTRFVFTGSGFSIDPPREECMMLGVFPRKGYYDDDKELVLVCITSKGFIHRHPFSKRSLMFHSPARVFEVLND